MSETKEMLVEWKKNFQLEVQRDGFKVLVDQPKEEGGDGAGMGPVDLFIAGLGACIGYYALVFLSRRKIDPRGLKIRIWWEYAENPRRVAKIDAEISLDADLDKKQRSGILRIVQECTVHNTLSHTPEIYYKLETA